MADEKGVIATDSNQLSDVSSGEIVQQTAGATAALSEAAGVYGNAATAEELGYVQRGYVSNGRLTVFALADALYQS
jgi:hypothetical protein